MAIPTPSFFKIRLTILIIGFVVVCFLVGVVKDVFAKDIYQTDGECTVIYARGKSSNYRQPTDIITQISNNGIVFDTIEMDPNYITYLWIEYQIYKWDSQTSNWVAQGSLYNNAINWEQSIVHNITDFNNTILSLTNGTTTGGSYYIGQNFQCISVPCQSEADALTAQCGGPENEAWQWSDKSTCTGECLPCTGDLPDGQETLNEAAQRCTALDKSVATYDEELCRGVCDTCAEEDYLSVKTKCGKLPFTFSEVTCDGECNWNCDHEWASAQAQTYCGPGTTAIGYTCEATPEAGYVVPPTSVTCRNADNIKLPRASTPGLDSPDDPEATDTTPPAADPADTTDPNQWSSALKANQDSQIRQGNAQLAEQSKQSSLLNWIGENASRTTSNTDAIAKAIQDGLKADVNLDGVTEGLEEIDQELEGIKDGEFIAPVETEKYESDEEYSFGDRTSEFLNNMKSTGLFSVPNSLSQSIPSGGSSTLTISTGATCGGDHTIDFNWLFAGLIILKYLFQIAGMALAIRIVTLHR